MNSISASEAVEMLAEVSGVTDIEPDTKFGKLSLDSLMLMEWVSLLEERINSELNIRDLDIQELNELTIGEALDVLLKLASHS
jgi:acyl carrier protein